ncbi:hypothetical protein AMATHDRAFT_80212 [Amanita thiersii Skay4041]|uniref:RING-type domain-containing protein n=1 Tax=Amanita thiersii Skay4041 TaxID=703135 RepID=A0A2A9NT54_9AGAR|nr:hypothetical protein AMATHDRAFT_80212 [Amanita thiersii Skay4041]
MAARVLTGTVPGLLDPTQPLRLLRHPTSTLLFAAFDPLTATVQRDLPDIHKRSLDKELYRPKRVVVEIALNGGRYWRFVPNARREEGVVDEGSWPRDVDICGEIYNCTQDQWDIHKLDPQYDCCVWNSPQLSTIRRSTFPRSTVDSASKKRPADTQSPERSSSHMSKRRKRAFIHSKISEYDCDSIEQEEVEVVEMIIDNQPPLVADPYLYKGETHVPERAAGRNQNGRKFKPTQRTRESLNMKLSSISEDNEAHEHLDPFSDNVVHDRKRKDPLDSSGPFEDPEYVLTNAYQRTIYAYTQKGKRARTVSPRSSKRELESKRLKRSRQKNERREREQQATRESKDATFLRSLFAELPDDMRDCGIEHQQSDEATDALAQSKEEELARRAAIEESQRKLAQLEADRPLWEDAAKRRMMRENAEQQAIRVKAASLNHRPVEKKVSEKHGHRKETSRQENESKDQEEVKRQHEEAASREKERRKRQQQRWAFGPWTVQRAIERYKYLSEDFDNTKFSNELPLTIEAVPWPVLHPPTRFTLADVDWQAVEEFFDAVKIHMMPQELKTFVEKSHRRFHPDRWRSRSLLKTVVDDEERDCLEVVFSQALGREMLSVQNNMSLSSPSPSDALSEMPPETIQIPVQHPPDLSQQTHRSLDAASMPNPLATQHTQSPREPLLSRFALFFGFGGQASDHSKLQVGLVHGLLWCFIQIVVVVILLVLTGTHYRSTTNPQLSEWRACDRPLGIWSCIWVLRVCLSMVLKTWDYKRKMRINDEEMNAGFVPQDQDTRGSSQSQSTPAPEQSSNPHISTTNSATITTPYDQLFSRLTLVCSLLTLSWFLTAHILEYTSIKTCRHTSPHLWWLMFGILCIMYLMISEILILAIFVFIIGPLIFLVWNIILIALGRPIGDPTRMNPEIGKLPRSVVDRIPLVIYIPPPPNGSSTAEELKRPETAHIYPPPPNSHHKGEQVTKFKFLKSNPLKRKKDDKIESTVGNEDPSIWESNWEPGVLPFVILQDNRAACAICLLDFEAPRRKVQRVDHKGKEQEIANIPLSDDEAGGLITQEERTDCTTLKDDGSNEQPQPLRLLQCGHVFHKPCLDPWLIDVSGRCPVCQQAVSLPKGKTKGGNQTRQWP